MMMDSSTQSMEDSAPMEFPTLSDAYNQQQGLAPSPTPRNNSSPYNTINNTNGYNISQQQQQQQQQQQPGMSRLSFLTELGYNDYYHRHQAAGQRDFERRTPERTISSDSARSLPRRFAGGLEAMQSSVFRTTMEYSDDDDDDDHQPRHRERSRPRRSVSSPHSLKMMQTIMATTASDDDYQHQHQHQHEQQQHEEDAAITNNSNHERYQKRARLNTCRF